MDTTDVDFDHLESCQNCERCKDKQKVVCCCCSIEFICATTTRKHIRCPLCRMIFDQLISGKAASGEPIDLRSCMTLDSWVAMIADRPESVLAFPANLVIPDFRIRLEVENINGSVEMTDLPCLALFENEHVDNEGRVHNITNTPLVYYKIIDDATDSVLPIKSATILRMNPIGKKGIDIDGVKNVTIDRLIREIQMAKRPFDHSIKVQMCH